MKTNKTDPQASTDVAVEKTVAQVQQEPTLGGSYIRTPESGAITPVKPVKATQPTQE